MTLSGEGEYNLNILKEIEVTESFLELDHETRKCQRYKAHDSYDKCTTGYFMEQMRIYCGCLPYATINNEKVCGDQKEGL